MCQILEVQKECSCPNRGDDRCITRWYGGCVDGVHSQQTAERVQMDRKHQLLSEAGTRIVR